MTAEKEYWFRHNYRRNLLDMHISDSDEAFLTRFDPAAYADALKEAGVQAAVVKAKSHTGLCYWPAGIGRMLNHLRSGHWIRIDRMDMEELPAAAGEKGFSVRGY